MLLGADSDRRQDAGTPLSRPCLKRHLTLNHRDEREPLPNTTRRRYYTIQTPIQYTHTRTIRNPQSRISHQANLTFRSIVISRIPPPPPPPPSSPPSPPHLEQQLNPAPSEQHEPPSLEKQHPPVSEQQHPSLSLKQHPPLSLKKQPPRREKQHPPESEAMQPEPSSSLPS
ncbi:hypothetical protein M419DRAFT_87088 [Trichoderma reesei RUT C-30]|uniref:Uncharacterized protein n=1 Tax=Hypocrea jecorina (strain ATCC 56765 / BCRC 32924 / NRRL 11460 / Rut C-30) TaxID=1344414 RepID=A0A024S4E6_HYPJR|nr:hypothetical protein M419DRAFT_87088 [Trichoderma reesei RUT C-30]